jgi:hypothetical protein
MYIHPVARAWIEAGAVADAQVVAFTLAPLRWTGPIPRRSPEGRPTGGRG